MNITMYGLGETKLEKDSAGKVRLVSQKRRAKNTVCQGLKKTTKSMRRLEKKLRKEHRDGAAA